MAKGHHLINIYDELLQKENDLNKQLQLKHQANQEIADMLKEETNKTISLVLNELSLSMKINLNVQTHKRGSFEPLLTFIYFHKQQ